MLSAALLSAAALRLMAVGSDEPSAAAAGAGAAAGVPSWARGPASDEMAPAERERLRLVAKEMFYHGYDSVSVAQPALCSSQPPGALRPTPWLRPTPAGQPLTQPLRSTCGSHSRTTSCSR